MKKPKRIYQLSDAKTPSFSQYVAVDKQGNFEAERIQLSALASSINVASPSFWPMRENPNNPITPLFPAQPAEQYVPSCIVINGVLWLYIKGAREDGIFLYKSVDNGVTWQIQNNSNPILEPSSGEWDEYVTDPLAIYDEATGVIRLYYKGSTISEQRQFGWGLAIGNASNPASFIKESNPIFTAQDLATDLGLSLANSRDNALRDVIKMGNTFYFYFYCAFFDNNSGYQFYYLGFAKGTSWNNPANAETFMQSRQGGVLRMASVFRNEAQGVYNMVYDESFSETYDYARLKNLISYDGENWQVDSGIVATPVGGANTWNGVRLYSASLLKKPVAPYDALHLINGEVLLFASGSKQGGGDTTGLYFANPISGKLKQVLTMSVINEPLTITSTSVNNSTGFYFWLPILQEHKRFQITVTAQTNQASTGTMTVTLSRFFGNDAIQLSAVSAVTVPCGSNILSRVGFIEDLEPRVTGFRINAWLGGSATSGTLYNVILELLP